MMTGATPFCDPTPFAAERFQLVPQSGNRFSEKIMLSYSLTVRTTLEVGFELTVGSLASLRTSSS